MTKRKFVPMTVLTVLTLAVVVVVGGCPFGKDTSRQLKVVNNTTKAMSGLYLRPQDGRTWGANQASSGVAAGDSYSVTAIPVGVYDLRAQFTSSSSEGSQTVSVDRFGVPFTDENYYWFFEDGDKGAVVDTLTTMTPLPE